MRELQPRLWWWEAAHPEWTPDDGATEGWGPEVSSYAIDDGERLRAPSDRAGLERAIS